MTVHTCAHSKMPRHNIVNNVKLFSPWIGFRTSISMCIDSRQSIQLCPYHMGYTRSRVSNDSECTYLNLTKLTGVCHIGLEVSKPISSHASVRPDFTWLGPGWTCLGGAYRCVAHKQLLNVLHYTVEQVVEQLYRACKWWVFAIASLPGSSCSRFNYIPTCISFRRIPLFFTR